MSNKRQKKVVIKFYMSADDRTANERLIGRPSVATTVRGFRSILERYDPWKGPYMAYFDENGNDLGAAGSAEDHLSG